MLEIKDGKIYYLKMYFIKGVEKLIYSSEYEFVMNGDDIEISLPESLLNDIIVDDTRMIVGECIKGSKYPDSSYIVINYSIVKNKEEKKLIIKGS